MKQSISCRERMSSFIQGKPIDRVPFVQYSNIGGKNEEIWDVVGQDAMGILTWTDAAKITTPHCSISSFPIQKGDKKGYKDILTTPKGILFQERYAVPAIAGVMNIETHYVKDIADYQILLSYLSDMIIEPNIEVIQSAWKYVGDHGLPHICLGRTPYQQLWIQWVSMMDLSYHLVDEPALLDEVMELMGVRILQMAQASLQASEKVEIPYVVIGDNITAPLIGASRFEQYCLRYYREISSMLAEREIPLVVHMDGDLLPLSSLISQSGIQAIDSFSPPPDNDTSVASALHHWPHMKLMMNFPSSVHLWEPSQIYDKTIELLKESSGTQQLQIQISEDPPQGRWKVSYPQIIRAIEDFSTM